MCTHISYRICGTKQNTKSQTISIDTILGYTNNRCDFGAYPCRRLAAFSPLNRPVFVKRKHNLLSAGADHVYPIIIVYQSIVWLFPCGLRGISNRDLPASLPIKGWISLPNHVTYAHNSGIKRHIYGKSALSIPNSPLMDCYFYTSTNGEMDMQPYMPYCFFFIIFINRLLLLHFCKWRMTGSRIRLIVFSSSPLIDCYFYTSANGEMDMQPYMPDCFFFIVSINGLLLLHFCKWRNGHVAIYA